MVNSLPLTSMHLALALSLQLSHSFIRLERYLLSKLVHLTRHWITPVIHRACCEAQCFKSDWCGSLKVSGKKTLFRYYTFYKGYLATSCQLAVGRQ